MKFNKKIALVSVAALMSITPVAAAMTANNTQTVQAASYQTRTLTFDHNSYVYNKNGKRLTTFKGKKAYFKKNSKLKAAIATSSSKTHYYVYGGKSENYQKVYLQVYTIKGKKYYNIGNGGYININNINLINGSTISTDLDVKVRINKNVTTVSADGTENNTVLKKGTVITADGHGAIPGGEWIDSGVPATYYHVKGTKDEYVIDDHTTLLSPVQNGNEFDSLFGTSGQINGTATEYYTVDGTDMFPGKTTSKYANFSIDGAIYLWVPSENKAELFYHVELLGDNKIAVYDKDGKQTFESPDGDVFVKASAITIDQGIAPKPANTASEAEANKGVATSAEKTALANEIAKEKTVEGSLKYTNASKTLRTYYDDVLASAKKVSASTTATANQVVFATYQLQMRANDLDGQKITVAYPNYLTSADRTKIRNAAVAALGDNSIQWANHDTELWQMSYSHDKNNYVTYKKLDINDYIQAETPKIKNKKGYDSSATESSVKKDATLAKYAKMLDYNWRTSRLMAARNTPVYQSTTKVGTGANFNVNKITLKKTKKTIKKGNNLGYYATLIVKIKGQYYFMFQEKSTYFIKASDVKLDNFSTSANYKKYQKMIDDLMGPKQVQSFGISALVKKDTTFYNTDKYMEIIPTKTKIKKGKYAYFDDPYIVKYNGAYYLTGGKEFNDDYDPEGAIRAADIEKIVTGQILN